MDDADPVPCCPLVDAAAERHAVEALATAVAVPTRRVNAVVHSHLLTLSGDLSWHFQCDAAMHAVRDIPGVTAVMNALHVQRALPAASA